MDQLNIHLEHDNKSKSHDNKSNKHKTMKVTTSKYHQEPEKRVTLAQMSAIVNRSERMLYKDRDEGKFECFGRRPSLIKWSEMQRYARVNFGIIIPDNESKSNGNPVLETKTTSAPLNGHAPGNDIDSILSQINTEDDPALVKTLKEKAQALKIAQEVQRKRKIDGDLISIEDYRMNVSRLGQMVRKLANEIHDGFLSQISGMSPPQIQQELEIRVENYCKNLAELEWEDEDLTQK